MRTIHDDALRNSYIRKGNILSYFRIDDPELLLLRYSPGDLLTAPFSPSQYLQFVVDGELLLYDMPDDSSVISFRATDHNVQIFGDMELIDPQFTPFFVEAKTEVYALAMYHSKYKDVLLDDPVFLRHVCLSLAKKLQAATEPQEYLPLKDRVAHIIQRSETGGLITDIAHLSHSLNVSNRQLIRILKRFCEEGVLEHIKKGVYRINRIP